MRLLPHLVCTALLAIPVIGGGCSEDPVPNVVPTPPVEAGTKPPGTSINERPHGTGSDSAPAPTLGSITPLSTPLGSDDLPLIAKGVDFVPRSTINLDGSPLPTTFTSPTELAATLPAARFAATGSFKITVSTGAPGGGTSAPLTFTVENPAPTMNTLAPLSVVAGSGEATLSVQGTGFVQGSVVAFGTTPLTTTFTDREHLAAKVPANLLTKSSLVDVSVTSPAPGGGTSGKISFTVSNPDATITGVVPPGVLVGAAAQAITVNGTGFVAGSKIFFNGVEQTTAAPSAGKLTTTLPATAFTASASLPITVQIPQPSGAAFSAPFAFMVAYPTPALTTVSPLQVIAGNTGTLVTVTGSGFVKESKINFNGVNATTTFVSGTKLTATLSADVSAAVGSVAVVVVNPGPIGGGTTATSIDIKAVAGKPILFSGGVLPTSVRVGDPDTVLTISGAQFITGITATVGGKPAATSMVTRSSVKITVPASYLTVPDVLAIALTNPAAGGGAGGTSDVGGKLDVLCKGDISQINVFLTNTADAEFRNVDLSAVPATDILPRWSTTLFGPDANNCPGTLSTSSTKPVVRAIVQNSSPTTITLSTYAKCDATQGGYIATYADALPADRKMCSRFVADGRPHDSPMGGGNDRCPGLTKANGGGLPLDVCKIAVVELQAGDDFSPPQTMFFKAD